VDSGLYIAVFYLRKTGPITVGKLGTFKFRKGFYFYVGSGRCNLTARIERHGKKKKLLRWHIDYFSSRAKMLGAIIISDLQQSECELAEQLSRIFELTVTGFGASDCRCDGHLFYSEKLP
jgi:sugar fermentation stimulation protein A